MFAMVPTEILKVVLVLTPLSTRSQEELLANASSMIILVLVLSMLCYCTKRPLGRRLDCNRKKIPYYRLLKQNLQMLEFESVNVNSLSKFSGYPKNATTAIIDHKTCELCDSCSFGVGDVVF